MARTTAQMKADRDAVQGMRDLLVGTDYGSIFSQMRSWIEKGAWKSEIGLAGSNRGDPAQAFYSEMEQQRRTLYQTYTTVYNYLNQQYEIMKQLDEVHASDPSPSSTHLD